MSKRAKLIIELAETLRRHRAKIEEPNRDGEEWYCSIDGAAFFLSDIARAMNEPTKVSEPKEIFHFLAVPKNPTK